MSEPADARGLARRAFLVTGAGLVPTPAEFAQSRYPSKPEQLIVPLPAGTSPDLVAQRIEVAFAPITSTMANLKGGKVRALGISSAHRVEALADIAPPADTFPWFTGESWHGVVAPRGTPKDLVSATGDHSQRIVGSPDFRGTLTGYGLVPAGGSSAEFRQFLAADASAWARVIRSNNITVD